MLQVRDTGVGIAPEILPRIFDLFTEAERSLDRSQGGLGIGLALVQRLVEMHGGTVAAFSALGQGSEFVVRLPVVSAPEPQASLPPSETTTQSNSSLRVLLVDDNVDTVTTLALLVKESGHDVRTAYDGPAVLEAALDYRPNVVLLDIGLPGFDGFEVAKRLRQQQPRPANWTRDPPGRRRMTENSSSRRRAQCAARVSFWSRQPARLCAEMQTRKSTNRTIDSELSLIARFHLASGTASAFPRRCSPHRSPAPAPWPAALVPLGAAEAGGQKVSISSQASADPITFPPRQKHSCRHLRRPDGRRRHHG